MNVKTARTEAYQALGQGDPEAALRFCRQGLYQAPDQLDLLLIEGHAYMRCAMFAQAAQSFEQAAVAMPDSPRLRCLLAAARERIGNIAGATEEYRAILSYDPRMLAARYNLATLLAEQGDFLGAIHEYQELIRQEPDCVQAHNNLGVILEQLGDAEGAIASFERARRACPGDAISAVNLARAWVFKGELRRAEEALSEALDVAPLFGEALALAGWLLLATGKPVEAEIAYRQALAEGFDTPETREGHARAASQLPPRD